MILRLTLRISQLIVILIGHRKDDDQTKVMSYISALSESCLASHLIKWVTNQIGMDGKIFRQNVSTPVALISEYLWYPCILDYIAKFIVHLQCFPFLLFWL